METNLTQNDKYCRNKIEDDGNKFNSKWNREMEEGRTWWKQNWHICRSQMCKW